ncbi:hypothetical protein J6590_079350 [Homalodisca vitripennis]|nr:hypothetical protein J6590_079350 [Homalodisca vitripennis]
MKRVGQYNWQCTYNDGWSLRTWTGEAKLSGILGVFLPKHTFSDNISGSLFPSACRKRITLLNSHLAGESTEAAISDKFCKGEYARSTTAHSADLPVSGRHHGVRSEVERNKALVFYFHGGIPGNEIGNVMAKKEPEGPETGCEVAFSYSRALVNAWEKESDP